MKYTLHLHLPSSVSCIKAHELLQQPWIGWHLSTWAQASPASPQESVALNKPMSFFHSDSDNHVFIDFRCILTLTCVQSIGIFLSKKARKKIFNWTYVPQKHISITGWQLIVSSFYFCCEAQDTTWQWALSLSFVWQGGKSLRINKCSSIVFLHQLSDVFQHLITRWQWLSQIPTQPLKWGPNRPFPSFSYTSWCILPWLLRPSPSEWVTIITKKLSLRPWLEQDT